MIRSYDVFVNTFILIFCVCMGDFLIHCCFEKILSYCLVHTEMQERFLKLFENFSLSFLTKKKKIIRINKMTKRMLRT
ncbi:hypothetical protein CsatB_005997 [Cannabis sativa]